MAKKKIKKSEKVKDYKQHPPITTTKAQKKRIYLFLYIHHLQSQSRLFAVLSFNPMR